MLNRLMRLHPLTPPTHKDSHPQLRERRAAIRRRTAGSPHAHVLLVQGRGGDLAINGAEVARVLLEQIVTRGDRVLGVALGQRVRLVVVLAQNLLEVLHVLHLRLRLTDTL